MKTKPTGREGGREGENSVGFNELEFLDEDNKDEEVERPRASSSLAQGMHATLPLKTGILGIVCDAMLFCVYKASGSGRTGIAILSDLSTPRIPHIPPNFPN